ncbi:hypothetical protein [Sulfitobacter sp. HGT1]|uniref:hypothetical protein n=1 Tax=Sulfitobacter sp. HGT1 TaxID=2735435 RepID=UPI001592F39E|nr:hypothetical protein [Sulfitobacter sp. HGT1]
MVNCLLWREPVCGPIKIGRRSQGFRYYGRVINQLLLIQINDLIWVATVPMRHQITVINHKAAHKKAIQQKFSGILPMMIGLPSEYWVIVSRRAVPPQT